ncbi:MAG: HAD-IC family P-type ATPase, partial [Methanomicrobiales archaeon]|nr:HAD-IC family P-type ATPase [Methanomicrobiales archaeon]
MTPDRSGLTTAEAQEALLKFGENEIYRRQKISFFSIARHEVTEPMILLLLFIGVVYSIWGEIFDALTIIFIITLLVFVEVYNEYRAKNAIAALERITSPRATVLRDGQITDIDALQVAPGDLLVLTAGTKVAADARVTRSIGLQADESALTGESFPVEKQAGDAVYAGTVIVSGEGDAEVNATGKTTRLGQLAITAQAIRPPRTRLQLEMKALAGTLVYVAAFVSVSIGVIGLLRGNDLRTMVLTALSLSFATVPEELPIIITMVLGLGAYQLSKKNFLVKKLKAAETMGTTTVIVTDKTGTLTQGRMQIAALIADDPTKLVKAAVGALPLYSSSPMDRTLREKSAELGVPTDEGEILWQRDFGNGRKTRATLRRFSGQTMLYLTGAPEEVFAACTSASPPLQERLAAEAAEGRRVIAVAEKPFSPEEMNSRPDAGETGLACVGLISFDDPPRPGVKETIGKASVAGIRTIMV